MEGLLAFVKVWAGMWSGWMEVLFHILFSRSVYILQMDLSVISLFKVSLILLWLELATHSKQLLRLYLCLICNASSLDGGIIYCVLAHL